MQISKTATYMGVFLYRRENNQSNSLKIKYLSFTLRFKQLNNDKTLVVGCACATRVATRRAVPSTRVVITTTRMVMMTASAGAQLVSVDTRAVGVCVIQPVTAVDVVGDVADTVVAAVGARVVVGVGVAARPVRRC